MPRYDRGTRSVFGPIVLVAIGVFMLLASMGKISWPAFGEWFARYWPVLLILAGVVRLFEYVMARRSDQPLPRTGAGTVFLIILLVLFGFGASSARRHLRFDSGDMDMGGPWAGMFRGEAHEYDLRQEFPMDGKELSLNAGRADVTVSPSSDEKVHIMTHLTVYAHSQDEADRIRDRFQFSSSNAGGRVMLTIPHEEKIRAQYEIQVPETAALDLTNSRGDFSIRDRKAKVTINTSRSDITAEQIGGDLTVHSSGRSNVTVHKMEGDVNLQGSYSDTLATDVSGAITLDGDFFGDMRLQKIDKGVHFHSSRTDLELAKVEGELNMSSGNLQASSVAGPLRLITHEKDVHLQRVSGDVDIENRNASIEVQPESPVGNVRVQNSRGSIEFVAPAQANFALEARADSGEITSDLSLPVQNNEHGSSSVSGNIGKGGNRVVLSADRGSINLRKQ
jgi:DUF4097 and DUF4098 domain-containing protein YvlB